MIDKKTIIIKYSIVIFLYFFWSLLSDPPIWSKFPVLLFLFQYVDGVFNKGE